MLYQKPENVPILEISVEADNFSKELLSDFYSFIKNKSNLTLRDSILEMFKLINNNKNKEILQELQKSNMADQIYFIIKLAVVEAYNTNDISYMYMLSYFAAFSFFLEGGNDFDCTQFINNTKMLHQYMLDLNDLIKLLSIQIQEGEVYLRPHNPTLNAVNNINDK